MNIKEVKLDPNHFKPTKGRGFSIVSTRSDPYGELRIPHAYGTRTVLQYAVSDDIGFRLIKVINEY